MSEIPTGHCGESSGEISYRQKLEIAAMAFLARFVGRGWLHATREDPAEQAAVDLGLRRRWLRRELGEAHFTRDGRRALTGNAP